MTEEEYMKWLENDCGYINAQRIPGTDTWVAFERLMFHWSLIGGPMFDQINVNHRYCYQTLDLMNDKFEEWKAKGFEGQPEGWHKQRGLPFDPSIKYTPISKEEADLMMDDLIAAFAKRS